MQDNVFSLLSLQRTVEQPVFVSFGGVLWTAFSFLFFAKVILSSSCFSVWLFLIFTWSIA